MDESGANMYVCVYVCMHVRVMSVYVLCLHMYVCICVCMCVYLHMPKAFLFFLFYPPMLLPMQGTGQAALRQGSNCILLITDHAP